MSPLPPSPHGLAAPLPNRRGQSPRSPRPGRQWGRGCAPIPLWHSGLWLPRILPHRPPEVWAPAEPQRCSQGQGVPLCRSTGVAWGDTCPQHPKRPHVPSWLGATGQVPTATPERVWGPTFVTRLCPARRDQSHTKHGAGRQAAASSSHPAEGTRRGSPKVRGQGHRRRGRGAQGCSVVPGSSFGRVMRSPSVARSPPGWARLPGIDDPANDGGE